jgi:hypothetical protein
MTPRRFPPAWSVEELDACYRDKRLALRAPSGAICSSARRRQPLHARDTHEARQMSSQGVLWLLPLLTPHRTWQHLQSLEGRRRSQSSEALL